MIWPSVKKGFDDGHDRQCLGLVAFETADLQGESASVDEQSDHDLRIDSAFFGVADAAQVVFLVGLEVERGDVVEHQADIPGGAGVGKARRGDLVAVATGTCAAQSAFAGRQRRRGAPQLGQDPINIEQTGGLHHPGDHQVPEDLIADRGVETQAGIHLRQDVIEQPAAALKYLRTHHQLPRPRFVGKQCLVPRCNHMGPNSFRGDPQIQLALGVIGQQPTGLLHEQTQLGVITRRSDMADDPAAAIDGFGDLDRRRARSGAHSPNPDHPCSLLAQLVPKRCTNPKHHRRSAHYEAPQV